MFVETEVTLKPLCPHQGAVRNSDRGEALSCCPVDQRAQETPALLPDFVSSYRVETGADRGLGRGGAVAVPKVLCMESTSAADVV